MKQPRHFHRRQSPLRIAGMFAACLVCCASGCQFVPKTSELKWPWAKNDMATVPERILAVWTDTVMHQPNQPGVRGFGGRIYFYEADGADPIEIDGGLAIYVFDTESIDAPQEPLKKYVFTAEQFAGHMSQTSIGPSYSVWLPWGEVGGPPRKLSLIARFQGSDGGTVISDPTIKLLPGVVQKATDGNAGSNASTQNGSHVALASHESRSNERSSPRSSEEQLAEQLLEDLEKRRRAVETIDLPPSFQRHLDQGATNGFDSSQIQSSESGRGSGDSNTFESNQRDGDDPQQTSVESTRNSKSPNSQSFIGADQARASDSAMLTKLADSRARTDASIHENSRSPRLSGFTGDGSNKRSNIHEGRWLEPPRDRR